ncbi:uncharacterized protein [Leuresthes tenuis]|uniref:uncharacterized protein n=1 Tax=Leuresthes tenuis TaxID=355514 RepID=UPI003B50E4B6
MPWLFEDRAVSPGSTTSIDKLGALSPDSPIPEFTQALQESTVLHFSLRSTSPESVFSDEDLETDLCMPWLFEDRAVSPGSTTSIDKLGALSPDSPIPEFTVCESTIPHIYLRSTSPQSVFSDLEMDLPFSTFTDSRPSSPESFPSKRLSPDSPLPDFVQPMFGLPDTIAEPRSTSPESACSDIEYIVLSLGSLLYDNRQSSPGSEASGDEYQALSPDSPIPEYRAAVPERVIINVGYRSPSPESIESDVEYALSEFLMSLRFGIEDRPDSPESVESEMQERPLSVESIPEYKSMSPVALMLLENIRSVSPESTQPLDENKRLSPDYPLPWFAQNVFETTAFTERFRTVKNISQTEFSDSDDLLQSPVQFCTEARSASPEFVESDMAEIQVFDLSLNETIDSTVLATALKPFSSQESASLVAEYNLIYDAELWKLISQVRDPQYAGETFNSKTGFMQSICSTTENERSGPDNDQVVQAEDKIEQDATDTLPDSGMTHQFTTRDTPPTDLPLSESHPPVMNQIFPLGVAPYRQAKYTFEIPGLEANTVSDDDLLKASISDTINDDLCYSAELFSLTSLVVEARGASPESVKSFNGFRPLSPDSPLPEYSLALPERVQFLKATCSSPKSLSSHIDYMPPHLESDFVNLRPSTPESTLTEDQNKSERLSSPESLPEYRRMSFESATYMCDKRASSPESMPELDENRSLSPDSPIPQFTAALEEYTTICKSSSPESLDSDGEYELMVISSKTADTNRPSSPESISSVSEFQQLLPDSPVPEFMRILSSYFMNSTPIDRSSSPVSFSSDSEFVALPIDCWIDECPRPLSPESVELDFCYGNTDKLASSSNLLRHVAYPSLSNQSTSLSETKLTAVSPSPIPTSEGKFSKEHFRPNWQHIKEPDVFSYKEGALHGSEAESVSSVCEEEFREGFSLKPSPIKDVKRKEEKVQHISSGELKNKTAARRASSGETNLQTDNGVQNKLLSVTTATKDASKTSVWFSDDKPMTLVPVKLPKESSYTTHRAVTPVLPTNERASYVQSGKSQGYSEWELISKEAQSCELFSPISFTDQFLVPPDYEAIFSGYQTLKVSEYNPASLNDLSPVSPLSSDPSSAQAVMEDISKIESETVEDLEFSPDFNKVLSDFERAVTEFESQKPNIQLKEHRESPESSQHSDSDLEFFDCRQDFSEPDDMKPEHEIAYNICEPPSSIPRTPPDIAQPFLWVENRKHFSSGCLDEFAYGSESSKECPTGVGLPICEELPSRDQAGYYDDDDFLGRVRG